MPDQPMTRRRAKRALLRAGCGLAVGLAAPGGAAAVPLPGLPPGPASPALTQSLQQATGFIAAQCTTGALRSASGLAAACEAAAEQAGTDAYVYGIAPMEFLRQRHQQTSVNVPNSLSDAPVNQFGSARQLASTGAGHQVFVQPNNDTLYSMAHLDLGAEPLVLHVPRLPRNRYYVLEFLDPYTNVFAYVGTRTTGDRAGSFLIAGPSYRGAVPRGMRLIRSPYRLAWIAGRTLVYGSTDLGSVHRIQDGYRLIPLRQWRRFGLRWRPRRPRHAVSTHTAVREPAGVAFFDALGDALAQSPPPAADAPILGELKSIGIGAGLRPSREHLSAPVLQGLATAANGGYEYVYNMRTTYAAQVAVEHHGWFVPFPDTGDFGTDYRWRAIVALFGLAANRPAEAVYTIGVLDQSEQQLDGSHAYMIHFAADRLPPARFFWSLTMYDDRFFLVPNAIGRYALGNRSPLQRNADGSLDIYLQHTPPTGHESNWLPAPAVGKFEVTLRMYGPSQSVLDDTYAYPPIERVS